MKWIQLAIEVLIKILQALGQVPKYLFGGKDEAQK